MDSRWNHAKKKLYSIYKETLFCIRNSIGDVPIWISTDKTTDENGRFIVNIIIRKLNDSKFNLFLLDRVQLDKCNHLTITRFLNISMGGLMKLCMRIFYYLYLLFYYICYLLYYFALHMAICYAYLFKPVTGF